MTHGAIATTPTTHSGAHWAVVSTGPSADESENAPPTRNATMEPIPTSPSTTGTHIHCASFAECPPTCLTMFDR